MDIQLLRTFLSVCELRHFGRAAEQLCVTQSAVSARIRLLEETLGVTLIDRRRLAIAPTAAGLRLLPHARAIVDAWTRARLDTALVPELNRVLGVGASPDLWPALMARGFAAHAQAREGIAWRLESDDREVLIRRLRDGQLDLVLAFDLPGDGELCSRELWRSDLLLCSSAVPDDAAAVGPGAPGYVQIERAGPVARRQAALFTDSPAPRLRTNSARLALDWLRQVGGSAHLDAALAAPLLARGELHLVAESERLQRRVHAVYRDEDQADIDDLLETLVGGITTGD